MGKVAAKICPAVVFVRSPIGVPIGVRKLEVVVSVPVVESEVVIVVS